MLHDKQYELYIRFENGKQLLTTHEHQAIKTLFDSFFAEYASATAEDLQEILDQVESIMDEACLT